MSQTSSLLEAERIMTICNACRYCEGHCAVFPAMEMRLEFAKADLNYLANLCHNCGACYHHCQYAEPHEFKVNVPRTFSQVRRESYGEFAWPGFMRKAFEQNGFLIAAVTITVTILFMVITVMITGSATFFGNHDNAFYGVISHNVMATLFGLAFLYAILALTLGVRNFWRSLSLPSPFGIHRAQIFQALHDTFTLKYLGGGNPDGCTYPTEAPSNQRKFFHHLTFYGFLLCFAATSVATLYHYAFNWPAPYDFTTLPKLLGIIGGLGLLIGPAGLLYLKHQADKAPIDQGSTGMDTAFLVQLFLTSLTGLILMFTSHTSWVGPTLTLHLGIVLSLFLTMPYGKFTHGFFRLVALVAYAVECARENQS